MRRLLSLIVVVVASIHSLEAAYPRVRNFYKNVYKAGTQNWDITQTPGGCMYFGNHTGLVEFDGTKWDQYYVYNGTAIRSLKYVAEENRLYAGAFDEFGYFETGPDGRLVYTAMKYHFEGEGMMTEFWEIHRIGDAMYFCTDLAIFKYLDRELAHTYKFGSKVDCSATIYNSLFVATRDDGPMIMSGDIFIPLPGAAKLAGKKICGLLPWGDNKILIATDMHGLYIYNGSDVIPYTTVFDRSLRADQIYCAAIDRETLALGTIRNGLYVIDISTGQGIHINRAAGLQNNTILSLYFDMDSNLWLGLDNGIDYVMLDLPDYSVFTKESHYGAGYSSLVYDGKLYVGTNQGLFYTRYDSPATGTGEFSPVKYPVAQVWHLSEIDNTLFCGHDQGLLIIKNGVERNISGLDGIWKVMPLRGRDDLILGCSYRGLFILRKSGGEWSLSHHIDGLNESSAMFVEDTDGKIWFTHWMKGLYRLTLDEDKMKVANVDYFGVNKGLPTDRNNIAYSVDGGIVFSSEKGFYTYDREEDRMVVEDKLNHLFVNDMPEYIRIHDLGQGDLLFVSQSTCAIAVGDGNGGYTMDSLSLRHISHELIIGFEDINMLDDDTMLVGTENGFSIIDLARVRKLEQTRQSHPIFIKSVWSTNRQDRLLYGERGNIDAVCAMEQLPYRDNSIRIEAASPEYRDPSAVEYSFLLEGYDANWSNYSQTSIKEYTRLSGRNYVLRVRAKNNFIQEITETELRFSVSPPWYLTNAAQIGYLLIFLLLMWLLVKFFNKRSDRKVRAMERKKEKEIKEQRLHFEEAAREKEKELVMLQNEALEYNLRSKSQELASSTLNLIRKNEILMKLEEHIGMVIPNVAAGNVNNAAAELRKVQKEIRENIEHDNDWDKFASNFDLVYENYLKRLGERYPNLNMNDKRLCAYLRMDLQSKDIAPLMNISVRSVEMARYRLRKKMGFSRDVNLSEYLQNF